MDGILHHAPFPVIYITYEPVYHALSHGIEQSSAMLAVRLEPPHVLPSIRKPVILVEEGQTDGHGGIMTFHPGIIQVEVAYL